MIIKLSVNVLSIIVFSLIIVWYFSRYSIYNRLILNCKRIIEYYRDILILIKNSNLKELRYYRIMAENLTDMISSHKPDGEYIYVSPFINEILGYTQIEMIGTSPYDYIHPKDIEAVMKWHMNTLHNENVYKMEYRMKRKDGMYVWVETSMKRILDNNNFVKELIAVTRDISKNKEIQKEVFMSNARFSTLINSMEDVVFTIDKELSYSGVFGKWYTKIGLKEEDIVGKKIREVFPDQNHRIHEESAIKALKGEHVVYNWSLIANNKYLFYQISLSPMENSKGEIIGVVAIGRDITKEVIIENELKISNEKLKRLSFLDGLTNIPNRRYFDEYMSIKWQNASGTSIDFSMIMIDVDYFKAFNDTYGHIKGDECLKIISKEIRKCLRKPGDLICRYGGEEFAIVLPETSTKDAEIVAHRIRSKVEDLKILNSNSPINPYITVSIGFATLKPNKDTLYKTLISNADRALYKAKEKGRNRIEIFCE
ncbi:phytochrome-like protein cph2 [Clostridium homopropionicum DSM 5847]|uniref:Phytochrome-like protein cph2 n=1 Tax=Clostridium homopropionicum DSM 5847 TaxID=1121318 RepID=A0A0L6ZES3_9CLOT|nr:diguanylate cyclase [Clostridium homopropionicum]KOA21452.1 phytochrome-like protein cph2 [Clostridium homopropionicum DSM 5847]SFG09327.1 PAS domain S-box-containing protein/diguanylate cyclase (GGDEF) domain-containing protein [Clostridium homopropionicum]